MLSHRPRDQAHRQPRWASWLQASTRARPRPDGLEIAGSLNLRRGGIGLALVVGPADFQIVALVAAPEAEFDIGILGDRSAPIRNEHVSAVIFEGQSLDKMRRNNLALGVLHEAGIHRMLDQHLNFGDLSARDRPPAK